MNDDEKTDRNKINNFIWKRMMTVKPGMYLVSRVIPFNR